MAWDRNGTDSSSSGSSSSGSNSGSSKGGTTSSNTSSGTSQSGSSSSDTQTSQVTDQQNMSSSSLAALELLIQQLIGGGTKEQVDQAAQRQYEIDSSRATQAGYSKDAAFSDAQGAMSQQLRTVLESLLPSITRSAEGSGTSQNSMRALLLQDVGTKAAESSASLGLKAATDYGNITTALSGILETLTRPNDVVTKALLDALNVAKGAVSNTTTESTESTTGTTSSSSNTNSNTNSSTSNNSGTGGSSSTSSDPYASTSSGLVSYGSTWDPAQLSSLAWSNLMSASGASDGYNLADLLDTGNLSSRTTF